MGRQGVQNRQTLCWFVLFQWGGWLVGQCSGAPAESTWLCEEIVKEDKAEDKEIDKQDKQDKENKKIEKVEDKEIDKVEKGIDRVNKDKEVGSKERGSRLCLLETVTELGLRNLLFVYFLFGGRPGVGKV